MDDTLETPRPRVDHVQEGDDHSSGDEDAGLDWSKLPKPGAAARPIIPKRGEKDFEPASGGSGLQLHILDRSRDAMFEALRASRTISSKNISHGIWYPSINRVHVTTARGIHFSTMGHSASRREHLGDIGDESRGPLLKLPKRLELLPEEALYLVERGALLCYKPVSGEMPLVDLLSHETQSPGAPMSVQQAFAEMIGCEGITLERYQVYAYLKRLGFILMRAEPPTPEYPVAPPVPSLATRPKTLIQRSVDFFVRVLSNIVGIGGQGYRINWWKRLQLCKQRTAQDIFRRLRFIPCGHTVPLYCPPVESRVSSKPSGPSPYRIFFHVYKPSTPFRKTAPPAPDFYVVVVDARTTAMPSLHELAALFNSLPEMPLPPPRKRNAVSLAKQEAHPQSQEGSSTSVAPPQPGSRLFSVLWALLQRLLSFLPRRCTAPTPQKTRPTFTPPKPNFLALKTGKKIIVIAAVDSGNISFFRFGQGAFEEWPMI